MATHAYIEDMTKPADDWCRETAATLFSKNVTAGGIIDYLVAYGCGLFAAQAIVTKLQYPGV